MRTLTTLAIVLMVSAACATPPPPTSAPSPTPAPLPQVRCVGLSETEPDVCGRMVALVQETYPEEVRAASRVLVVDVCPPRSTCDRQFWHDAAVLVVPPDGDETESLQLRVFGQSAQALSIEAWTGPLPDHVASLLAEG